MAEVIAPLPEGAGIVKIGKGSFLKLVGNCSFFYFLSDGWEANEHQPPSTHKVLWILLQNHHLTE